MIGDASDIFARLKRLMPRWFGQDQHPTPVLDGVLRGPSSALAHVHELYRYAVLQTRLRTATGGFLDLAARDFFGGELVRRSGQSDAAFRTVLLAELFRPRATRQAVGAVIERMTGHTPRIFEPDYAPDTGGYDVWGGYDEAGGWGDHTMTAQAFVDIVRARPPGIPNVSGLDEPFGGFDQAAPLQWSPDAAVNVGLADAEILAAINRVRPVGVTLWVRFLDAPEHDYVVGGDSDFSDGSEYSDGGENFQPNIPV